MAVNPHGLNHIPRTGQLDQLRAGLGQERSEQTQAEAMALSSGEALNLASGNSLPILAIGARPGAQLTRHSAGIAPLPLSRTCWPNTAVVPQVPPYRPGEFYLRELPPLRAVLDDLTGLGLLVVGRCADLDPSGRPGLGALHTPFGIPVIGVAKSKFHTATHAVPAVRGWSGRPLFVTAAGNPMLTPPTWSGAWLAGTGCPTQCIPRASRSSLIAVGQACVADVLPWAFAGAAGLPAQSSLPVVWPAPVP